MTPYYDREGIRLYCGDNRAVVPLLGASVAAVVTDPPYGLSFMGKGWDHEVPGSEFWQVFRDAMEPGAHLLAFGGTRLWHRLAVAIEDAGFDIKDTLAWLHGQGFPKHKSLLKPAFEPVILARKKGKGVLQIDACRIATDEVGKTRETTPRADRENWRITGGSTGNGATSELGRWPANVCLDEDAAAMLDQMSGERKSGAMKGEYKGAGNGVAYGQYGMAPRNIEASSGGASRFMYVAASDDPECLICMRTYAPNDAIMNATERVATCDHASTAVPNSLPRSQVQDSAAGPVPGPLPLDSEDKSQSSNGPASTAAPSSGNTKPTPTPTATVSALDSLAERLAPRVKSAGSLCDTCTTAIAQSLAAMLQGQTPASLAGLDSIPNSNASTLTHNLASFAEPMVNTGIIPTTASLSILFGSVAHAIAGNTSKALGAPSTAYAPTRFLYQSKALGAPSTAYAPTRFLYQSKASRRERSANGTVDNIHPTCKPLSLMKWLLTLATPPGGIVLDPFAGSGSTLVAAASLGIPAIGVEMSEEYCEIAARRIDHALNERAATTRQLEMAAD